MGVMGVVVVVVNNGTAKVNEAEMEDEVETVLAESS